MTGRSMKRYYRVKPGDIFFSENNGVHYKILGKSGKLYEARTWQEDENGDIEDITIDTGYVTDQELRRLIKEETGLNYEVEWEEDEEC